MFQRRYRHTTFGMRTRTVYFARKNLLTFWARGVDFEKNILQAYLSQKKQTIVHTTTAAKCLAHSGSESKERPVAQKKDIPFVHDRVKNIHAYIKSSPTHPVTLKSQMVHSLKPAFYQGSAVNKF